MPVPSSTVPNLSDQNQHAMLTTELLDTADIGNVPANLSAPFDYLTSSDTDADNADLCSTRRWVWYCKDPACPRYWGAWTCKSNFWLHLYETSVHRADLRTHTRVGRRELARAWRVETDWEMNERKLPKPNTGHDGIASGNEEAAGV